jgi:formate dehydrogenase
MTGEAVIDTSGLRKRGAVRGRLKGRQVDPRAAADIAALLGTAPRRRDLLIEHLHRIQDHYGCIRAAHIVALAAEMKLALTEVFEVATFYHPFDVIDNDETAPPPVTVRICETLSCEMAGAATLRAAVSAAGGSNVRVIGAPCIGRCEHAPAAVVGRNPVDRATAESIAARHRKEIKAEVPRYVDYSAYQQEDIGRCSIHGGQASARGGHRRAGAFGLARLGRRRVSDGPQVAHRPRRTRATPSRRQHR